MFIVYRMRKKDEGSYALDEPKRSPAAASYGKGHNNREFYAWDDTEQTMPRVYWTAAWSILRDPHPAHDQLTVFYF